MASTAIIDPPASNVAFEDLHVSPLVRISTSRCLPGVAPHGAEEAATAHSVVFMRRGAYVRRAAGGRFTVDANTVLFYGRGEPYRIDHFDGYGDECTIVRIGDEDLLSAAKTVDPRAEDATRPLRFSHGFTDADTDLQHRRLSARLREDVIDDDAASEAAFELVESGLRAMARMSGVEAPAPERTRDRRDHELAESVRELLAVRFREKLSLAQLAAAVDCTPFHLARLFRRQAGASIHAYRMRLRLRAATESILAGDDITQAAVSAGFYDHSHLTNSFRAAAGFAPSALRRRD